MASKFDESEFIDADFQTAQREMGIGTTANAGYQANRPPSREEIEARVSEAHTRLADLKRAQEQLERERAALEDVRRRRVEFQNGREEMLHHLTRGVDLLKEAEFSARREAEQMSKTLADLSEALARVESCREEQWTQENWNTELTRALTTLENARMEWNSARLKWPMLDGAMKPEGQQGEAQTGPMSFFEGKSFGELCSIGLALSWPVALATILGATVITVILLQR